MPSLTEPCRTGARASVRRRLRNFHVDQEVHFCARSLNGLYAGHGKVACESIPEESSASFASAAQVEALRRIRSAVIDLGAPPPDLDATGALRELRVPSSYSQTNQASGLGSYDASSLSLPDGSVPPVALEDLLCTSGCPTAGREFVDNFYKTQILPYDCVQSHLSSCGVKQCYSDPRLRHRPTYAKFVRRLFDSKCIEFSLVNDVVEFVEVFFVRKKGRASSNGRGLQAEQLLLSGSS